MRSQEIRHDVLHIVHPSFVVRFLKLHDFSLHILVKFNHCRIVIAAVWIIGRWPYRQYYFRLKPVLVAFHSELMSSADEIQVIEV